MYLDYHEFSEKDLNEQIFGKTLKNKLPATAKENLNKEGKRKPMTSLIARALYDTNLEIDSFRRIARTYYKTSKLGNSLWLTNDINGNYIIIDFTKDLFGYMSIRVSRNNTVLEIPTPKFNSDLFKKITYKNLL